MVYHEEPDGRRFNNDRSDTDEALLAVGAFPRLKRLYLQKGQATDGGLLSLAQLTELEELMVWDAHWITDVGVSHLAGLAKLKSLHFSNGQLGDASLAVFGRLPSVQILSLQGNSFSDEGLKHLAGLKQLRSLWVGMNKQPITDAGVRHLTALTSLQGLDLQGAHLTDAAVAALKDLKQLRSLYLCGAAGGSQITDASIEPLLGMTKLQDLGIQNTRLTEQGVKRLLTLPELKTLNASTSAISEDLQDRLRKERPGLQLNLSVSSRND
jgi:Leucine-rich repeat (LRR) protein